MSLAGSSGFALLDAHTGARITEQAFDADATPTGFAWSGDSERLAVGPEHQ